MPNRSRIYLLAYYRCRDWTFWSDFRCKRFKVRDLFGIGIIAAYFFRGKYGNYRIWSSFGLLYLTWRGSDIWLSNLFNCSCWGVGSQWIRFPRSKWLTLLTIPFIVRSHNLNYLSSIQLQIQKKVILRPLEQLLERHHFQETHPLLFHRDFQLLSLKMAQQLLLLERHHWREFQLSPLERLPRQILL